MHLRSLLAAGAVAALLAPSLATARIVHSTCIDGVLVHRRCRIPIAGLCRPVCDADQTCNGVCTFVLPCSPVPACVPETVTVSVGEKKVVTFPPTKFILRCRRHPAGIRCPMPTTTTSTTTTSTMTSTTLPCHFDTASNGCQGGCPEAGTECLLVAADQCACRLPGCHTCWLSVSDFCTDKPCSSDADCRTEPNLFCLADKCEVPCPTSTTP